MAALEPIIAKAVARSITYVGSRAFSQVELRRLARDIKPLMSDSSIARFLTSLSPQQSSEFLAFVKSAQFEHLALITTAWYLARKSEPAPEIRHTVRLSLQQRLSTEPPETSLAVDVVMKLLTHAVVDACGQRVPRDQQAAALVADIAAANARNSELLSSLESADDVYRFANLLKKQVASMRSKLRLTHVGSGPAIRYEDLFVESAFTFAGQATATASELLEAFQRVVVLGDPGAGKSTFASKLAYDLAIDRAKGFPALVPFLVIARDHAVRSDSAGSTFVEYLAATARHPYNVDPPDSAIEHLLLNGQALVIIDGLDEVGDTAARRRFTELIEGFAHFYPTCRIIVTSRVVGYDECPLDKALFKVAQIEPFEPPQVATYTEKWFALDRSLTKAQREQLVNSFLNESESVDDLRRNPLLLSLLCSLYSSKHYIPRYRTEIYEQCAELLFEQWDQRRGIYVPLRFRSHVRPAVARVAWMLFNDQKRRSALPRQELLDYLTAYMNEERFTSPVDAASAADEFLQFCAGRAWVLTEFGTSANRPIYGFTHRTFLEYFTAVQLVRRQPTVEAVWSELRRRIDDPSWVVVSDLAVQILDRTCDGGANNLLNKALVGNGHVPRLGFAIRVANAIVLSNATLQLLSECCLLRAVSGPPAIRRGIVLDTSLAGQFIELDAALWQLLKVDYPDNVRRLAGALDRQLHVLASSGERRRTQHAINIVVFLRQTDFPAGSVGSVLRSNFDVGSLTEDARHLYQLATTPTVEIVTTHGAACLFGAVRFYNKYALSPAGQLIRDVCLGTADEYIAAQARLEQYRPLLTAEPWPWLREPRDLSHPTWAIDVEAPVVMAMLGEARIRPMSRASLSAMVLLVVPYVEFFREKDRAVSSAPWDRWRDAIGRWSVLSDIERTRLERWNIDDETRELIRGYLEGQSSPIAHRPR